MTDTKKTPFYDFHVEAGARMVPFAGYHLPVQYSGVIAEHKAVRERVGLFDVSHMGEVLVEGKEAKEAVQYLVTNNILKLKDGRAIYCVMCKEDGGIIDDLIVYRQAEESYFLVVNAARLDVDFPHILKVTSAFDCTTTNISDEWAQLALQGPRAEAMLQTLVTVDLADLAPFAFIDTRVGNCQNVRVARTGYTGEAGFELYCKVDDAAALWQDLEQSGKNFEMALCGLGCRDSLRLEVKYPLYGNDIDEDHNPIEAGLGWVVKFKAGDFLGREAVLAIKKAGPTRKWVGFKMSERGIARHGHEIFSEGQKIGDVTSGTHAPTLGAAIGCGYVPTELSAIGTKIDISIRGKMVAAEVVATPFYKREEA